jgi:hypothetical protein
MRRHLLIVAALLTALSACKPPRSPREAAEVRISGDWFGSSAAHGQPLDTGNIEWRLRIDEGQGGKFNGQGALKRPGMQQEFELDGLRGEGFLTMEFDLPQGTAQYKGSVMDIKTIVGELVLEHDTLALSLTRVR